MLASDHLRPVMLVLQVLEMQLLVQLLSDILLYASPHVGNDVVADYVVKATLHIDVEAFELERELVLIVNGSLHDLQVVSDGWHQDTTVDIDSGVEVVDEGVQHDAKVKLAAEASVLEDEQAVVVSDQGCHSDAHRDLRVIKVELDDHDDVL